MRFVDSFVLLIGYNWHFTCFTLKKTNETYMRSFFVPW